MKASPPQTPGQGGTLGSAGVLRWMVAGMAVVLLAVVAGFVLAGRLRMKNYLKGLPARLGVDIEQETNNFTYSQSKGHRKIFTVRAAKEIQHKGGTITLHDVGIVLYGPAGEATDRIKGADFEYNQKAQTLTATGDVYIDLVPPAKKETAAVPGQDPEAREIHVKTTGLRFDQKEQTATTAGAVEFRTGGYKGNAVGASYDAEHGVMVLESEVRMSGVRAGKAVTLTAARAEVDRLAGEGRGNAIDLKQARYVSVGHDAVGHNVGAGQSFAANRAVVHMMADGTPRRVDAEGEVTLGTGPAAGSEGKGQRGRVQSDRLQLELGPDGLAQSAHLYGAVRYQGEGGAGRRERGTADDARVTFDPAGRAEHATFAGEKDGIQFVEEAPGAKQRLEASRVEVGLGGGGKEPLFVRTAEAFGSTPSRLAGAQARLVLSNQVSVAQGARGTSETEVRADRLVGAFAAGSKRTELTGLDGSGHSSVQRVSYRADRVETAKDTSSGDALRLEFAPEGTAKPSLRRGELRGRVTAVYEALQTSGTGAGKMSVEHARADNAVFEAEKNMVHLTGGAEVQDDTSALFADKLDLDRGSGEATALGSVKVSYMGEESGKSAAGAEPVHVLAARAVAHRSTGAAQFFADGGAPVRLWQGTSQVEAAEVDFLRREKRVVARSSHAMQVKTVLAGSARKSGKNSDGPVRVLSREMTYTDSARTVEFGGGVRVVDQAGTMTAKSATVWLAAASPSAGQAQQKTSDAGLLGGKVDHIVANGAVTLSQPGRTGTGEKLTYTAADALFVLTGTPAAPPKVVDAAEGMTTGAALRFHSGDDSVEVLGSDGTMAGRVRSETRMRQ